MITIGKDFEPPKIPMRAPLYPWVATACAIVLHRSPAVLFASVWFYSNMDF
jgi:hypothetical protein